jgi:hypothetical protein
MVVLRTQLSPMPDAKIRMGRCDDVNDKEKSDKKGN